MQLDETDDVTGCENRRADVERSGRVMLDPLTEVGIGVLVPVVIGRGQFVVHVLRDGERGDRQQQQDESDG